MDPSSSHINVSSEISVDAQPHQPAAKNVTHMDVALYKAAARGKIDEFSNFKEFPLESLLTPNQNTVLHVHLATYDPFDVLGSENKFRNLVRRVVLMSQDHFGLGPLVDKYLKLIMPLSVIIVNEKWKVNTSFIEQILDKSLSLLEQPNAEGQTPLYIAASNGRSDAVKYLINYYYKEKISHGDEEKQKHEMQSVREMLRKMDLESNTALHVAAQRGHLQVVKELLKFEDPDFQYLPNRNQETPLYIASRGGYHSLLAMMLEKFKSPILDGPHGRTVLHAAAMGGCAMTTRIILKKVHLTKETDENGQTPLHYAAHLGKYKVVKMLLKCDKSAAYVADKKWGMTPLLMAARQGHGEIVREIISSCPDCCEMVDKRGWNLLHFVAVRKGLSELRIFLKYGHLVTQITTPYASIRNLRDKKDVLGITPLQVFDACHKFGRRGHLFEEKNQSTKQMGQVMKEKDLTKALVRPIGDEKDAQNAKKKEEQIAQLLEDILKDEVAEEPVRPIIDDEVYTETHLKDGKDSHLVVATLIATVTFASAIAVPGGYKSEKGPDQGTAFLIRETAFKAFVISDALAFLLSLAAIYVHFARSFPGLKKQRISFELASAFIAYAVVAMVIAFSTGTYAVLQPYPLLAFSACCIGLTFFLVWGCTNYLSNISKDVGFD